MDLPANFKDKMKELLGEEYDDLIASYDDPPVNSLRVNNSRITTEDFLKIAPYDTEQIPFIPNGFYIKDTDAWSKHPYYFAGLYYLQEASAMLPAQILPVTDDDTVCDLCAAPGGKSTQIAAKAGLLVSNDISRSRTIPLVKNLEDCGSTDYMVTCEDPLKLAGIYREAFDKVLVDAPCSGEGMFRKDAGLIASYMKKGPDDYCNLQRKLLEAAYDMTKAGGMIMYSTCTFSDTEDEETVLSFVRDHKDIRVSDISAAYEGLSGPYDRYRDEVRIRGCVHAFPHRMRGEGHFMALMTKEGQASSHYPGSYPSVTGYKDLPGSVREFADMCRGDLRRKLSGASYVINADGLVTMLPDKGQAYYDRSIRYARTGTCIGTIVRSGRFEPHTAFALSMKYDDFPNTVIFDAGDENVYRYLRGETIVLKDTDRGCGYVLICVDRYPLGFAKYDGIRLKNLYDKGRIRGVLSGG